MKVLLPTDFSDNAFNACRYALQMFAKDKVTFTLLHTYDINGYVEGSQFAAPPSEFAIESAAHSAENALQQFKTKLVSYAASELHEFQTVIKNLDIIDAIVEQLRLQKTSLIVIGTQGSTGAYQTVYGSNTIKMMEEIKNCPIMAIPADVSFNGINEIVLANGYKIHHKPEDFTYLKFMAEKFKAPIRVLHISEIGGLNAQQLENKAFLESQLQDVKTSFHMLEHVNVPIGIYCFSESRNSDLISFVNKKYSFIEKLLFKPLYKNLGNYSKTPVLVLHQQ